MANTAQVCKWERPPPREPRLTLDRRHWPHACAPQHSPLFERASKKSVCSGESCIRAPPPPPPPHPLERWSLKPLRPEPTVCAEGTLSYVFNDFLMVKRWKRRDSLSQNLKIKSYNHLRQRSIQYNGKQICSLPSEIVLNPIGELSYLPEDRPCRKTLSRRKQNSVLWIL